MGTITDYDTLKAAVQSWGARSDAKFSAQVPLFVSLAEDRMYDGYGGDSSDPLYTVPLRAALMESATTLTLTAGTVSLPSDFLDSRRLSRSGDRLGIDYLPPQRFALEAERLRTGVPVYYTIESNALKVVPSYTGDLSLLYYKRFPAITDGNKTGTLIAAYGNVYLSSCLYEGFAWMQEADIAMAHLARYRSQVAGLNRTANRTRQPGQRMRVHMRGALP